MSDTAFILTILCTISFLFFVHPYVLYPLSLKLMPAQPINRRPAEPLRATLMFSAYNEAASLPLKIENIRVIKALHPDMEFLAYSDMSSDDTLQILEDAADVLTVIPASERTGKAAGMGLMVKKASGEICIFTDANTLLKPESVKHLLSYFSDPEVGGVAGSLYYTNEGDSTTALVGGLYWRLEEKVKQLESRTGSIMGADGAIFAIRRSLYPYVPPHLLDDMTVSMSIVLQGMRLVHATDVHAYERSTTVSSDEFRRKRRIACRAFNTHRYLQPMIRDKFPLLNRYKYFSHKLLRWFGAIPLAFFVLFACLLAIELGGVAGGSLVVAGGALLYGLGRLGVPVLAVLSELLHSIVATYLGIIDSSRGKTYQTWTPAASR